MTKNLTDISIPMTKNPPYISIPRKETTMYSYPVELTLSRDQWGLLMMFVHQSAPMLPRVSMDSATDILNVIETGLTNLELKWEVAGDDAFDNLDDE